MPVKNKVLAIPLVDFNVAGLTAVAFTAMTTLPHAVFLLRIINECDTPIIISYDGVTAHDWLPEQPVGGAASYLQLNFQTNSQPQTSIANLAQNTTIYGKLAVAGGVGALIIAGYYQPQV